MSVTTNKEIEDATKLALRNRKFLEETLDLYRQIKGDIRDYIHGPLEQKEYKARMVGYGKAIGAWRNFIAGIQVSSQNRDLDDLVKDMPKLVR